MPIDYKKYPPNWLSEIRPRIMKRSGNCCELCGLENYNYVWSYKDKDKKTKWSLHPIDLPIEKKIVKVILTIAHLDHDELNHDVTDDRLMAMCQLCHLRYDAKEKYRRSLL